MWTAFRAGARRQPTLRRRARSWRPPPSGSARSAAGRRRPATASRLTGDKHSRDRDRAAIAHHYDLSNDFYELLLDESMAYSCAYFTDGPDRRSGDAQRAKLDLVCRKLGLHRRHAATSTSAAAGVR